MFSQIEQIFSHIIRTRLTAFILMFALPIAARAQEVTIVSSPTSIMEGKTATFIISVTPAPTSNLRVNIEVTNGGPVISDSYTRAYKNHRRYLWPGHTESANRRFHGGSPSSPHPGRPEPCAKCKLGLGARDNKRRDWRLHDR